MTLGEIYTLPPAGIESLTKLITDTQNFHLSTSHCTPAKKSGMQTEETQQ